jgi:Na+/H+ antiporter NhaD/arsenite permease-like protein
MIDFKTALYDQICQTAALFCSLVGTFSLLSLVGFNLRSNYSPYNWYVYVFFTVLSIIVGALLRQRFSDLLYPDK